MGEDNIFARADKGMNLCDVTTVEARHIYIEPQ